MITPRDFENAKRLAGALERRFDGEDLQRLASVLNYVPEQLQVDILSFCRIVARDFLLRLLFDEVRHE